MPGRGRRPPPPGGARASCRAWPAARTVDVDHSASQGNRARGRAQHNCMLRHPRAGTIHIITRLELKLKCTPKLTLKHVVRAGRAWDSTFLHCAGVARRSASASATCRRSTSGSSCIRIAPTTSSSAASVRAGSTALGTAAAATAGGGARTAGGGGGGSAAPARCSSACE